jgi:hypothetical protein
MARLVVDAVTAEPTDKPAQFEYPAFVDVGVSVSRADDGTPVTGLGKSNFRLASPVGLNVDFSVTPSEWKWEPGDVEPAGCYWLIVAGKEPFDDFDQGYRYVFGIQVRTFDEARPPRVIDQGQTVVELIASGT